MPFTAVLKIVKKLLSVEKKLKKTEMRNFFKLVT